MNYRRKLESVQVKIDKLIAGGREDLDIGGAIQHVQNVLDAYVTERRPKKDFTAARKQFKSEVKKADARLKKAIDLLKKAFDLAQKAAEE